MPTTDPPEGNGTAALHPSMSAQEFDSGYHYAADLKKFARQLGIPPRSYRKIELEQLIRERLTTGRVPHLSPVPARTPVGLRDHLAPEALVTNYVDDKTTKTFLRDCVHADSPGLNDKSGQWYWLNEWRRKQQEAQVLFSYAELSAKLRELMQHEGRLPQIPSARMNNFFTDYRADPANPPATREKLLREWNWLKNHPGPKTYAEYRLHRT